MSVSEPVELVEKVVPICSADAGSIVSIKKYDRNFCAIGYVQIGDEILYSSTYATRNIQTIASNAITDTRATEQDGYTNEISSGVWSPYTKEQYITLMSMIDGGYSKDY